MIRSDVNYTEMIWRLTGILQGETNIEAAMTECLEAIHDMIGSERSMLWLREPAKKDIYVVSCTGNADMTGARNAEDEGNVGRCVQNGESFIVNDSDGDRLYAAVGIRKNTYGCIELIGDRDGFSNDELDICKKLGAVIALDMEDKNICLSSLYDRKPIVSIKGAVKDYPSGESALRVLNGIDLDIYENEFLVVLGESGCGKTTMFNIIGGMDNLTEGTLIVDGKDLSDADDKTMTDYRRDMIGFIFQNYHLMPNLTAQENVEFIAEISKQPISSAEAIRIVGLSERAAHFPSALSGGQQQRVSIAMAIVKNPRLILADEPSAALDFRTGQEILEVIERIVRKEHKTVAMITHNAEIAKMADRVVRLKNGTISSVKINFHPLSAAQLSW